MRAVQTLVIVANEGRARILENAGIGKGLTVLQEIDKTQFDDTLVRYSDAPGRSSAARGMAGHVMDRVQSERDQMREAFAQHVLDTAETLWSKRGYDRLAMAAPPKMLGNLRRGLTAAMKKALVADLDKDLLALTPAKLVDRFGDQVVF